MDFLNNVVADEKVSFNPFTVFIEPFVLKLGHFVIEFELECILIY